MNANLSAGIHIAAQVLKDRIPKDGTLEDRLRYAMRDVLAPGSSSAFMCGTDDEMFKGAVGGVLLSCGEAERVRINKALRGLAAISAMMSGVPIDADAVLAAMPKEPLPLLGLWQQAKEEAGRS